MTRDDDTIWQGDSGTETIGRIEEDQAAADPDHDWRVHFHAPLSERTYQRHGPEEWVLVETGPGFA